MQTGMGAVMGMGVPTLAEPALKVPMLVGIVHWLHAPA